MPKVYELSASIEIVSDDLMEFIQDVTLPDRIKDVSIEESGSVTLRSNPEDSVEMSKYVPTAQLKARVEEKRPKKVTGGQWKPPETEYGEEQTFYSFNGSGEEVLQNSKLQYEMFIVLKKLALAADGDLRAIVCDGETLTPIYIEDGEDNSDEATVTIS